MPWIAAVAALAPIVTGAIGSAASASDRKKALEQSRAGLQAWMDVNVPDPEQQKVILQRFVQQGTLDPKLEQAVLQGASELEKIKTDPRLKQSQLKALSSLEDIGSSGGLTLSDQANLQKGLNDVAVADRGRREAIADNMQRRGLSGSGFDQAAQLRNQQDATNLQSQQQLQTLGSARDRALQAITQGGSLAGQLRSQDYGEQKDLAGARDSIANFNARALAGVNHSNVGYQNEAQAANLKARQDIANANVGIANQQELHNKDVYQQQFDNQARKAGGLAGQNTILSNKYDQAADRTASGWAGAGSSVAQAGGAYGQSRNVGNNNVGKQDMPSKRVGGFGDLNEWLDKDKEQYYV